MTTEEAIKILEYPVLKWSMEWDDRDDGLSYYDAIELAISALRAKQEAESSGTLKTTYETPEICPHCMGHLSKDWSFCPECGRPTTWNKNDPLTPDELRELNGDPVWIVDLEKRTAYWALVKPVEYGIDMAVLGLLDGFGYYTTYGKTWLAYRRKPEEGFNENLC